MSRIRIAVLVSGGGTNLQALIDSQAQGKLPSVEIALVLSNVHGAYALERARKAGIPVCTVLRRDYPDTADFESALRQIIAEHGCELIVLAGFLAILSEDFTRRYPRRIINIHPSLIPAFCGKGYYGLHVHEAALARGVKVSGATVHFVNEIPDGGEILLQKAIPVLENDTPQSLQRRIMEQCEWILLPQAVQMVAQQILEEKERGNT